MSQVEKEKGDKRKKNSMCGNATKGTAKEVKKKSGTCSIMEGTGAL